MRLLIVWFLFSFMCSICVSVYASNNSETKNVQMTVEVISFQRNSGHYSLNNGEHYLIHHSTIYVHAPEKYKGMQIKIRHPGDLAPPKVWGTIGGLFKVSVPERLLKEWKPENYEIYAKAFKVITDQNGNITGDDELKSGQEENGKNKSIILIDVSVVNFRRNSEIIYYLNGTQFTKHATVLSIDSPLKYKGRLLLITHPNYEDPQKIWMTEGARFEAWIHKTYLEGQEQRIDWRALKMVREKR